MKTLAANGASAAGSHRSPNESPPGLPAPRAPKQTGDDFADVSHDDKKAALRAFHKRLKLARLNDESKLGGRYTSGGKTSKIDAVEAPREFPERVWKALVADGTLRDTGGGFYADA